MAMVLAQLEARVVLVALVQSQLAKPFFDDDYYYFRVLDFTWFN